MTKRLIDIDDDKLEAVQALFGTPTMKATVNDALDEVLALDERRRSLLRERGADDGQLTAEGSRLAAWD